MVTETPSFDTIPAFLTLAVFPQGPAATLSLTPLANCSEVASSESLIAAPGAPQLDEDEDTSKRRTTSTSTTMTTRKMSTRTMRKSMRKSTTKTTSTKTMTTRTMTTKKMKRMTTMMTTTRTMTTS